MSRFFLFLSCVAFVIDGCSDSKPPTSLIPLAVGNQWTYFEISENGTSVDTSASFPVTMSFDAIEGYQYYVTDMNLAFAYVPEGLSLAIVDRFEKSFDLEVLLKSPAPASPYEYTSTRDPSSYFYIVTGKDEIKTPNSTFEATTYRILRGDNHGFLFSISFSEGVGYVRLVNAFGTTWLLDSYDLVDPEPHFPFSS